MTSVTAPGPGPGTPAPPTRADAALPDSRATFLVIERDPDRAAPVYSVLAASNENQARALAATAARSAGRELIDLVTPAFLRAWIAHAEAQPPDLAAPGPA